MSDTQKKEQGLAVVTKEYLWIRLGDSGDYECYNVPSEVVDMFKERLSHIDWKYNPNQKGNDDNVWFGKTQLFIKGYFEGLNYISVFWGDPEAQLTRELTIKEWYKILDPLGCKTDKKVKASRIKHEKTETFEKECKRIGIKIKGISIFLLNVDRVETQAILDTIENDLKDCLEDYQLHQNLYLSKN